MRPRALVDAHMTAAHAIPEATGCKHYLLSHYHTDHTTNLKKSFNAGKHPSLGLLSASVSQLASSMGPTASSRTMLVAVHGCCSCARSCAPYR